MGCLGGYCENMVNSGSKKHEIERKGLFETALIQFALLLLSPELVVFGRLLLIQIY